MQNKIIATIILSLLLMTSVWMYELPSWLLCPDVPYARQIRDILEIPGTNILLACGASYYGNPRIWRSTNAGDTWTGVLYESGIIDHFVPDSFSNRIWTFIPDRAGENTLYFSVDTGRTWDSTVSSPPSDPATTVNSIEVIGNYVYYGGTITNPTYNLEFWRLNKTNRQWERLTQYPQLTAIVKLKYHGGNLIMFGKDRTTSLIRVFIYTSDELDKMATSLGRTRASEATTGK